MVNPSCNIPAREKGLAFPVVGDGPWKENVAKAIMDELVAARPPEDHDLIVWQNETQTCEVYKEGSKPWQMARMGIHVPGTATPEDIETVTLTRVCTQLYGWRFSRAWYYWICSATDATRVIPKAEADEFNEQWREEVRADGFGGGHDPFGDVRTYHVDTMRGLAALVTRLRQKFGDGR
jgi:hypothetical protein